MESCECDCIVIGAGPAGLMAAIAAARQGCSVIVCERQGMPGRKLLASGGGRCNVTNATPRTRFARFFGTQQAPMVSGCLKRFGQQQILDFFKSLGVPCTAADGIHYFPATNRASDVLDAMMAEAARLRITVAANCEVREIVIRNGSFSAVRHPKGAIRAHACVMAAGGRGYSSLGGCDVGYDLAARLGYAIVKPVPGLAGLVTEEEWPGACAGISLDWARIRICAPRDSNLRLETEGALLFTHRGISGPAALDISASVSRLLLHGQVVQVRCIPQKEPDNTRWLKRFEAWQQTNGRRLLAKCLSDYLPQRIVGPVLASCDCPLSIRCADVSRAHKIAITTALTEGVTLNIRQTEGWDRAMVTSGGISVADIDAAAMAGKLHRGIFFAGEIVDCDGPCGGFNLTWAFSSGWVAGAGAARMREKVR